MLLQNLKNSYLEIRDHDPTPPLVATLEKLSQFAADHGASIDRRGSALLEAALRAAAETEQGLAMQRARIRHLESLTITDDLTGLLNRRGFDLELDRTLARARRQGERGLLILCDLNRFKAVNDTYGHLAGDAVLRGLAQLLQRNIRQTDYVGRLGGDEFAILMTQCPVDQARARWRALEHRIIGHIVSWEDRRIPISASFGISPYGPESQATTLMFMADRDLYRNKGPRLVSPDD
jgi:diguanylate cyclase (GGDEF)-like protein